MEQNNDQMIFYMQQFTSSTLILLNLLKTSCDNIDHSVLTESNSTIINTIQNSLEIFINNFKIQTDSFDYSKFIKKIYRTFKNNSNAISLLKDKNHDLFSLKDENNKIITLIPGINIKLLLLFMKSETIDNFWLLFYLFVLTSLNLLKYVNPKISTNESINDLIDFLSEETKKNPKILLSIFNPFLGIGTSNDVTINNMTQVLEGPDNSTNADSNLINNLLNTVGIEKLINPDQLKDQLKDFGDDQIKDATDQIVNLLGAHNDDTVKEVCGSLVKDIIDNFKENGLDNIGNTLMNIVKKTQNDTAKLDKIKHTANSMHNFMANSADKIMEMEKDKSINSPDFANVMTACMNMLRNTNIAQNK